MIEDDLGPERLAAVAAELAAAGFPSVAFMKRSEAERALSRGKIETGEEYRLLGRIALDPDSGLDANSRARIEQLRAQFEEAVLDRCLPGTSGPSTARAS